MISKLLAIATNAFVESVRQPVMLLLILVCGLLQVFNTWNTGFSMSQEEASQVTGDTKLLFDIGLGTIFIIATLMAGFIATAVMSREIENKTVLTVVSKPVGRPLLVLGKFLGVAGAISAGVVIMLVFLLLAVRHGVMSNASDDVDGPVIAFGLGGVAIALILAGWCNFFYGWNFPQTSVVLLLPIAFVSYIAVLLIDKHWKIQPIQTDLKGQVMIACITLGMAVLVLTSVATAASARLSQVPTILTCLSVFVASLLSNHLIGRHVFSNDFVGTVVEASPADPTKTTLTQAGDEYLVRLDGAPKREPRPRDFFYYSPSPNGFPMMVDGEFAPYKGSLTELNDMVAPGTGPALVITDVTGLAMHVRNVGAQPALVARPPEPGDYVFSTPTRVSKPALVAWGAFPNMQFFWLLDAVSQNRPVPLEYLITVAGYSLTQITAFLSLAIVLFQKRDVG